MKRKLIQILNEKIRMYCPKHFLKIGIFKEMLSGDKGKKKGNMGR